MLSALVIALQLASQAPPALTVVVEQKRIDVVAFSDDGTFALLVEDTTLGATIKTDFLLVGADGIPERLPVSSRVRGLLNTQNDVDHEICQASAARLAAIAKDLRGVSVRIGLCAAINRDIVDVKGAPRPQVLSKKTAVFHQQVGFAGRVFLPPSGPLVVVIGTDELGNDRLGVTLRER
ncbi:MAG: hypothetical protein Q8O67_10725 [Deltaproteobacteria bacterium]|nr:hypothetical protein [Deltaproteobacteria bacterium]